MVYLCLLTPIIGSKIVTVIPLDTWLQTKVAFGKYYVYRPGELGDAQISLCSHYKNLAPSRYYHWRWTLGYYCELRNQVSSNTRKLITKIFKPLIWTMAPRNTRATLIFYCEQALSNFRQNYNEFIIISVIIYLVDRLYIRCLCFIFRVGHWPPTVLHLY